MEFRPRRSGKAKYGGFNVGSNNKGGRRWSPAVAARLANDDLSDIAPRKSRSTSRKSGASAQELTGWKFRGMLRSVLGTPTRRAAPRSHGATLMLQRAQRKAAEDARARAERKDGEQHEPRQVPTLASLCCSVISTFVDCVEDPTVLHYLPARQREDIMASGGGEHGVSFDVFRSLCGANLVDAVVRGPSGDDSFLRELVPRTEGVVLDAAALADELSSSSDEEGDDVVGAGGGTELAHGVGSGVGRCGSGLDDVTLYSGWSSGMQAWPRTPVRHLGCRDLASLAIVNCPRVTVSTLAGVLTALPKLHTLVLDAAFGERQYVQTVFEAIASGDQLEEVVIRRCRWLYFATVRDLSPLLRLPRLQRLTLADCSIAENLDPRFFRDEVCRRVFPRRVHVKLSYLLHTTEREAGSKSTAALDW